MNTARDWDAWFGTVHTGGMRVEGVPRYEEERQQPSIKRAERRNDLMHILYLQLCEDGMTQAEAVRECARQFDLNPCNAKKAIQRREK